MTIRLLFAVCLLTYSIIAEADVSWGPVPDWVDLPKPAFVSAAHQNPINWSAIEFHLPSQTATVDVSYRIDDPNLLAQSTNVDLMFDAHYQSIVLHRLGLYRDGQWLDRSDTSFDTARVEASSEHLVYSDKRHTIAFLKDVRLGDSVHLSYSIKGWNPIFERFPGEMVRIGSNGYFMGLRRVTVHAADDQTIYWRAIGVEEPAAESDRRNGLRRWSWQWQDLAPDTVESQTPRDILQGRWFQLSAYDDWKDVADWAARLFKTDVSPRQLLRQAKISADNLEDAVNFVQSDIRYLSLSINENSHLPRSPEEVIAQRFGDCKDKSLLLVTLAEGLKTRAYPVLVSTAYAGGVQGLLPSPSVFDHVIVKVVDETGPYWLDGTRTHQVGDLRHRAVGTFGVGLVLDGSGELGPINVSGQNEGLYGIVESYQFPNPGIVSADVALDLRGVHAEMLRSALAAKPRMLTEAMSNLYSKVHGQRLDVQMKPVETDGNIVFQSQFDVTVEPSKVDGEFKLPLYAGTLVDFFVMPEEVNRATPLALPFPLDVRVAHVVNHPNRVIDDLSASESVLGDGYFTYVLEVERQQDRTIIRHTLNTHADRVPVSDLSDHFRNRKEMLNLLSIQLPVRDPNVEATSGALTPEQRLRRLLRRRINSPLDPQ